MNSLFKQLFHIRYQSEAASAEAPAAGGEGGGAPVEQQGGAPEKTDDKPAGDKPGGEGDGKQGDQQDDVKTTDGQKKPEENKPEGAPEKYEFKAPEGSELDKDAVAQFEPIARELNLTQDQAQKLIDLYGKDVMPKILTQQADKWKQQVADWGVAAKSDKEFGGDKFDASMGKAKQAMDQFATPEFREFLESTGLGNHPEMVRFVVKVGKSMAEDVMHTGSSQDSGGNDLVSAFYPSKK